MSRRNLLVFLAIIWPVLALAEEPSYGPVIDNYGPTYPIADRDVALPDGFIYKTVFDVAQDPDPGAINRYLVSVARYLNMHARNGVPVEKMDLAIVVHGPAVRNMLAKEDNPNLELIAKLQEAGVSFFICGQSMTFAGAKKSELARGVQVGLSAMTMLTILQADDYALIPWGA